MLVRVNCDELGAAYWQQQIERVERLRSKIAARDPVAVGHVVPADDDLVIGDGRQLALAIMFLDISGFSTRAGATYAHQALMLRILNLFFTEMIRVAEDYGGTVEKNTGDGLMTYFEAPAGSADDASKRAVAAAMTMLAANEHLITPILKATGVVPIRFRISIDHGEVTIARLGAARRFNANVAIGAVANFASKMLAFAKPEEIVLGAAAFAHLPVPWQLNWTELVTADSGWRYLDSTIPYPLYRYTGRWLLPKRSAQ